MPNQQIKDFKALGRKYGFPIITNNGKEILIAKDTDSHEVYWISYDPNKDTLFYLGNTDQCNIWFYETRKDFTPEKIVDFVKDLNEAFELSGENTIYVKDLVDPEDWQMIAHIHCAYEDERYN